MIDNVVYATESIRTSVSSLKKKLSNLKISVEQLDAELDKIDVKFDKLISQTEIYKARLEREMGREVRRLELELTKLRRELKEQKKEPVEEEDPSTLGVASTMAVFECILRHIFGDADDLRLMSYSFLFPAVFERLMGGDDPAYVLNELPDSASIVIARGKEYLEYIRCACDTHVTDPAAWSTYSPQVTDWWRNDALPLIYGSRDEQWDLDEPLTLSEMLSWRDEPSSRPFQLPRIFDAYEIYRNNKEKVYDNTGVRSLDLKMFTFSG